MTANRVHRVPGLPKFSVWWVGVVLMHATSFAQNPCFCPETSGCGVCQGGLRNLSLQYLGKNKVIISVLDVQTILSDIMEPGRIFTLSGPTPDKKFRGNSLRIYVNGVLNATINSKCSPPVYINEVYGDFLVVGGQSHSGGSLCCSAGNHSFPFPVFSNCPADTVVVVNSCQAEVRWIEPSVTDQCERVAVHRTHAPGDVFPSGETNVIYTATDHLGHQSVCSFTVQVRDETPPVVTGCPSDITGITTSCGMEITWVEPEFSDPCGNVTVERSHTPGGTFLLGRTVVTYTGTDLYGNQSTCSFTVTIDDPPPVFTCPVDIVVHTDLCYAEVWWNDPVVTDNCGTPFLWSSKKPGDIFFPGSTEVFYKATDEAGNVTTCSFRVMVVTSQKPVFIHCPDDLLVKTDEWGNANPVWDTPVVSGACGSVQLTTTHEPGQRMPPGKTRVTYTATDQYGAIGACSFTVTVESMEFLLNISQLVTPDNDGVNDTWYIGNIEKFKNNTVTVVDRWGSVVYSGKEYNNENIVWRGRSLNGTLVPAGTYFYTITVQFGSGQMIRKGFLEIVR
jgi:gliding motility-associated-like protein